MLHILVANMGQACAIEKAKVPLHKDEQWFLADGEACGSCPATVSQNCAAKFGNDWENCGEAGCCNGAGCVAKCCLTPAAKQTEMVVELYRRST